MDKTVKISVVVPVYNLENYVGETIESVLAQTFPDWELILVNDGSKDNSLQVCRSYAEKDNRIIVLDQPNGGVSAARRAGLLQASGEYVTFLDGDDLFLPYALEFAWKKIRESKVDLFFGAINGLPQSMCFDKLMTGVEYTAKLVRHKIKMGLHAEFFRREVLLARDVRLDREIVNNEDVLYKLFLTPGLKSALSSSKALLKYRVREGSASSKVYPIDYWYKYFKYVKDTYAGYGISEKNYKLFLLERVTLAIRGASGHFDFSKEGLTDIKFIPYYEARSLYQLTTLLLSRKYSERLMWLMRDFHPKHDIVRHIQNSRYRLRNTILFGAPSTLPTVSVKRPKSVKLDGKVKIICVKGAHLEFGENILLRSNPFIYHGGMPFGTTLLADERGAIISIGNNCRINGTYIHAKKRISIGNNCVIAAGTNIFDQNGHQVLSSKRTLSQDSAESIQIGNNVWICVNSVILKSTIIGDNCIVAANSVVKGVFPNNCLIQGNPAKIVSSLPIV